MENHEIKQYRLPFEVRQEEDGNSSVIIDADGFVLCNVWNTHAGSDEQQAENQLIALAIRTFLNREYKPAK